MSNFVTFIDICIISDQKVLISVIVFSLLNSNFKIVIRIKFNFRYIKNLQFFIDHNPLTI